MRKLSDDLQDLRIALDIDLREAAELCRMTPVEYGQIERGLRELNASSFVRLMRCLLVPSRRARNRGRSEFFQKLRRIYEGSGGPP